MSSRLEALLICESVREAHWELAIEPAGVRVAMLGWVMRPEPIEAGVPAEVEALLAEVLAGCVTVSYFTGKPAGGVLQRLLPGATPGNVRQTRDAQAIAQLFHDEHFHWSLKAQAAFLSLPDAPPQPLGIQDLEDALAGRNYEALRARNIAALLLPGVDGDVAGFYALEAELWPRIRGLLQQTVSARGADWRPLDEGAFARALAGEDRSA